MMLVSVGMESNPVDGGVYVYHNGVMLLQGSVSSVYIANGQAGGIGLSSVPCASNTDIAELPIICAAFNSVADEPEIVERA